MSYLVHHGILGQKWGVRRYQPYSIGYQRKGGKTGEECIDKNRRTKEEIKEFYKRFNPVVEKVLKTNDSADYVEKGNSYDIVKAGKEAYRIAGEGDVIDDKPKYVTVDKEDFNIYKNDATFLAGMHETPKEYTYEISRDLKVLNGRRVADDLLKDIGNKKVSDLKMDHDGLYDKELAFLKKIERMPIKEVIPSGKDMEMLGRGLLSNKVFTNENRELYKGKLTKDDFTKAFVLGNVAYKTMKDLYVSDLNERDERFNRYKKMGYDAVVDIEDAFGYSNYPLIILNPKETLSLKNK